MVTSKKTAPTPHKRPGRPALKTGHETVSIAIRMTIVQRDKLLQLGGAQWVREQIDKAKEPAP